MTDWNINFFNHRVPEVTNAPRKGRSVYDGYVRGAGLQFGNIGDLCKADPDFLRALEFARERTIVAHGNLMNLYVLFRFYLTRLKPGAIAEFGCFKGGSCIFMAYLAKRFLNGARVFGFDTFEGMPPTDRAVDLHTQGDFNEVNLDELRAYVARIGLDNLTFVKGTFQDTLPQVRDQLGPLSLVHIDCDIYEALGFCYEQTKGLLVPGGYIVLDDPLTASCLGAFEAVEEHMIRGDNLCAEQVFPHLVFRYPPI